MSHLVKAKIGEIKHMDCLEQAVKECGGEWLGHCTMPSYSGEVTGFHFRLFDEKNGEKKKWRYTCAVRDSDKQLVYDNYGGVWGDQASLSKVVQNYAKRCTMNALRNEGFQFGKETVDAEGTITLSYWKD